MKGKEMGEGDSAFVGGGQFRAIAGAEGCAWKSTMHR